MGQVSPTNMLNQTVSTRNLSPNESNARNVKSLYYLRSGEKYKPPSFVRSPKNFQKVGDGSLPPRELSHDSRIGPRFPSQSRGITQNKKVIYNGSKSSFNLQETHEKNQLQPYLRPSRDMSNRESSIPKPQQVGFIHLSTFIGSKDRLPKLKFCRWKRFAFV